MRYDGRGGGGGSTFDAAVRKIFYMFVLPGLAVALVITFIMRYLAYIICIAVIIIACFLTCKYFRRKGNSEFKVFLTILVSLGLIGCVFLIVPKTQPSSTRTTPATRNQQSPAHARYMLVNSDALNVRRGASVNHDVVGQLTRNARVQVIDSSGQWWRIRYENIEGFVNSQFLIEEKTLSAPTSSLAPAIINEPGMGTTRSATYQREWEEAYERAPPVIPSGLVLPGGQTVEERVSSGRVYGK